MSAAPSVAAVAALDSGTPNLLELSQWLEPLLLKPLWKITSGYFGLAEQWYYAGVKVFQLDPDVISRMGDIFHMILKINAMVDDIVDQNHFHILGVLCEHARSCCGDAWYFADSAIMGMIRFDRVQLLEIVCVHHEDDISSYYAFNSDDEILRSELNFVQKHFPNYLESYRARETNRTEVSAICGSLNVLKWENEQGLKEWTTQTSELLIDNGHVDVLRELLDGGRCPWDVNAYWAAIKKDNVDLVWWFEAHDDDNKLHAVTSYEFARSAEMAEHFLEDSRFGCRPGYLMEQAATEGTLEMVKYLVEQTSAMDDLKRSDVVRWACRDSKGDPAKLKYLLERGFPMPWRDDFEGGEIHGWFAESDYEYRH